MTLGLRIRTLRKARKMTQQQLADVTQVSRIYIQALESNRRSPSMKLLHRLSEQLGVETSDLLEAVFSWRNCFPVPSLWRSGTAVTS